MEYKGKAPSTPISIPTPLFPQVHPPSSSSTQLQSPSSPTTPPPPPRLSPDNNTFNNCSPPMILTPCAACKILRRRCVEKCVLAPYFPPTDPFKFTIAHRVFGTSNIIKFLQDLPESYRADAVSSMVYEANVRVRDPVYGCAGAICQLQKQVTELQEQLARAQAELVNLHCQQTSLATLIRMSQLQDPSDNKTLHQRFEIDKNGFIDEGCSLSSAEWPESIWAVS